MFVVCAVLLCKNRREFQPFATVVLPPLLQVLLNPAAGQQTRDTAQHTLVRLAVLSRGAPAWRLLLQAWLGELQSRAGPASSVADDPAHERLGALQNLVSRLLTSWTGSELEQAGLKLDMDATIAWLQQRATGGSNKESLWLQELLAVRKQHGWDRFPVALLAERTHSAPSARPQDATAADLINNATTTAATTTNHSNSNCTTAEVNNRAAQQQGASYLLSSASLLAESEHPHDPRQWLTAHTTAPAANSSFQVVSSSRAVSRKSALISPSFTDLLRPQRTETIPMLPQDELKEGRRLLSFSPTVEDEQRSTSTPARGDLSGSFFQLTPATGDGSALHSPLVTGSLAQSPDEQHGPALGLTPLVDAFSALRLQLSPSSPASTLPAIPETPAGSSRLGSPEEATLSRTPYIQQPMPSLPTPATRARPGSAHTAPPQADQMDPAAADDDREQRRSRAEQLGRDMDRLWAQAQQLQPTFFPPQSSHEKVFDLNSPLLSFGGPATRSPPADMNAEEQGEEEEEEEEVEEEVDQEEEEEKEEEEAGEDGDEEEPEDDLLEDLERLATAGDLAPDADWSSARLAGRGGVEGDVCTPGSTAAERARQPLAQLAVAPSSNQKQNASPANNNNNLPTSTKKLSPPLPTPTKRSTPSDKERAQSMGMLKAGVTPGEKRSPFTPMWRQEEPRAEVLMALAGDYSSSRGQSSAFKSRPQQHKAQQLLAEVGLKQSPALQHRSWQDDLLEEPLPKQELGADVMKLLPSPLAAFGKPAQLETADKENAAAQAVYMNLTHKSSQLEPKDQQKSWGQVVVMDPTLIGRDGTDSAARPDPSQRPATAQQAAATPATPLPLRPHGSLSLMAPASGLTPSPLPHAPLAFPASKSLARPSLLPPAQGLSALVQHPAAGAAKPFNLPPLPAAAKPFTLQAEQPPLSQLLPSSAFPAFLPPPTDAPLSTPRFSLGAEPAQGLTPQLPQLPQFSQLQQPIRPGGADTQPSQQLQDPPPVLQGPCKRSSDTSRSWLWIALLLLCVVASGLGGRVQRMLSTQQQTDASTQHDTASPLAELAAAVDSASELRAEPGLHVDTAATELAAPDSAAKEVQEPERAELANQEHAPAVPAAEQQQPQPRIDEPEDTSTGLESLQHAAEGQVSWEKAEEQAPAEHAEQDLGSPSEDAVPTAQEQTEPQEGLMAELGTEENVSEADAAPKAQEPTEAQEGSAAERGTAEEDVSEAATQQQASDDVAQPAAEAQVKMGQQTEHTTTLEGRALWYELWRLWQGFETEAIEWYEEYDYILYELDTAAEALRTVHYANSAVEEENGLQEAAEATQDQNHSAEEQGPEMAEAVTLDEKGRAVWSEQRWAAYAKAQMQMEENAQKELLLFGASETIDLSHAAASSSVDLATATESTSQQAEAGEASERRPGVDVPPGDAGQAQRWGSEEQPPSAAQQADQAEPEPTEQPQAWPADANAERDWPQQHEDGDRPLHAEGEEWGGEGPEGTPDQTAEYEWVENDAHNRAEAEKWLREWRKNRRKKKPGAGTAGPEGANGQGRRRPPPPREEQRPLSKEERQQRRQELKKQQQQQQQQQEQQQQQQQQQQQRQQQRQHTPPEPTSQQSEPADRPSGERGSGRQQHGEGIQQHSEGRQQHGEGREQHARHAGGKVKGKAARRAQPPQPASPWGWSFEKWQGDPTPWGEPWQPMLFALLDANPRQRRRMHELMQTYAWTPRKDVEEPRRGVMPRSRPIPQQQWEQGEQAGERGERCQDPNAPRQPPRDGGRREQDRAPRPPPPTREQEMERWWTGFVGEATEWWAVYWQEARSWGSPADQQQQPEQTQRSSTEQGVCGLFDNATLAEGEGGSGNFDHFQEHAHLHQASQVNMPALAALPSVGEVWREADWSRYENEQRRVSQALVLDTEVWGELDTLALIVERSAALPAHEQPATVLQADSNQQPLLDGEEAILQADDDAQPKLPEEEATKEPQLPQEEASQPQASSDSHLVVEPTNTNMSSLTTCQPETHTGMETETPTAQAEILPEPVQSMASRFVLPNQSKHEPVLGKRAAAQELLATPGTMADLLKVQADAATQTEESELANLPAKNETAQTDCELQQTEEEREDLVAAEAEQGAEGADNAAEASSSTEQVLLESVTEQQESAESAVAEDVDEVIGGAVETVAAVELAEPSEAVQEHSPIETENSATINAPPMEAELSQEHDIRTEIEEQPSEGNDFAAKEDSQTDEMTTEQAKQEEGSSLEAGAVAGDKVEESTPEREEEAVGEQAFGQEAEEQAPAEHAEQDLGAPLEDAVPTAQEQTEAQEGLVAETAEEGVSKAATQEQAGDAPSFRPVELLAKLAGYVQAAPVAAAAVWGGLTLLLGVLTYLNQQAHSCTCSGQGTCAVCMGSTVRSLEHEFEGVQGEDDLTSGGLDGMEEKYSLTVSASAVGTAKRSTHSRGFARRGRRATVASSQPARRSARNLPGPTPTASLGNSLEIPQAPVVPGSAIIRASSRNSRQTTGESSPSHNMQTRPRATSLFRPESEHYSIKGASMTSLKRHAAKRRVFLTPGEIE
eukprot:g57675.t1